MTELIYKQYEQRSEKFDYIGQHLETTINSKAMEANQDNWISNRCNSCQTN
ncbi:unnamed protein product [Oppiella nova]|uniref:Uncharacterized protein n=1 Tax=Oppiella nova TaxID=334625 RepID=A0A7R9LT55_9ACAR|nr:unnamed protein product [Oppiella nova]CAG2166738.1 unnamed protein product [Oppiella nova]